MRVITFNTQGIEQAAKNGFFDWMIQQGADVVCLQDIKAREYQLDDPLYHPEGYHSFFFEAWDDDYSGVAIYTREMPKAVMSGLGFDECDQHGRFIQADFEHVSVASFCFPSGLKSQEAQQMKELFMAGFKNHLAKTLRKRREFIFCGTTQIANTTKDLSNWYANQTVSGFLPNEREYMTEIFDEMGYVDAFREINKAERQYTWWPDYNRARKLNEGARVDYQIATSDLRKNIKHVQTYNSAQFSEHAPVIIDYDF